MASSACLAAGIGGILIACGAGDTSDSSSPSPTTNDVTNGGTSIGPAGGTVTENGVTVTIPAGALAASTPIHITESTVVPNGYTVSGKVYRFEPSGTHFSAPITITLPSSKPEIVYWTVDGSETEFEPVETEFDEVAAIAKVQITHFSSGFVGTTPNGITCIVKQPSGCPGTKTTIEAPAFWYVKGLGSHLQGEEALATNSIGINRFMNSPAGEGVMVPNADRSVWKVAADGTNAGTAQVAKGWITAFTAKASRGGVNAGSSCENGVAGSWPPLVDYTCSGGNVWISNSPPRSLPDAGVSTDSGSSSDSSAADSGISDSAAGATDSSVGDAATEDAEAAEDSGVDDSGSPDSGVVDSGILDAAIADSGYSAGSYVQSANFDDSKTPVISGGYATYTYPFTNNVKAGHLLVVAYYSGYASAPVFQDTVGSTYASAVTTSVGIAPYQQIGVVYGIAPAGGKNSVVVKLPATGQVSFVVSILEYSGVTGVDTQNSWSAAAKMSQLKTFASGSVTTSRAHELLVSIGYLNDNILTLNPNSPGVGYTVRDVVGNPRFLVQDRAYADVGTYEAKYQTTVAIQGAPDSTVYAAAAIAAFY